MRRGLSNHEAAKAAKVTLAEIFKARSSGQIKVQADGSISPAELRVWQRSAHPRRHGNPVTHASSALPPLEPEPPPPGPRTGHEECSTFLFAPALAGMTGLSPAALERLLATAPNVPRLRFGRQVAYSVPAVRALMATARRPIMAQAAP